MGSGENLEEFKGLNELGLKDVYKKFRPRKWSGLLGQDRVVESLKDDVKTRNLAGAYGFFGPAGCGKTSAAFLFAKSLNCENLDEVTLNPCNSCSSCVDIDNKVSLGVRYISMANNGSVGELREIIEHSKIKQPVKQQVWILDEVHNLHKTAFDSLLIPTESEQTNSIFIMCSTEANKIPDTVLQRIQTRVFSKIDPEPLRKLMGHIIKSSGGDPTSKEAQELMAYAIRNGNGHARKTLSAMESGISLRVFANSYEREIVESILEADPIKFYENLGNAIRSGDSAMVIAEQVYAILRTMLLIQAGATESQAGISVIPNPVDYLRVNKVPRGCLLKIMETLGEGYTNMGMGLDQRAVYEVAGLKSIQLSARAKKMAG